MFYNVGRNDKMNVTKNNTFFILAIICTAMAVFSLTTAIFPIFFGSLAIIFAVLSKGNDLRMNRITKYTVIVSILSIIGSFALVGGTAYLLVTNEEYRVEVSKAYEEIYGISLEEYTQMIKQAWETGELPEEYLKQMERTDY